GRRRVAAQPPHRRAYDGLRMTLVTQDDRFPLVQRTAPAGGWIRPPKALRQRQSAGFRPRNATKDREQLLTDLISVLAIRRRRKRRRRRTTIDARHDEKRPLQRSALLIQYHGLRDRH